MNRIDALKNIQTPPDWKTRLMKHVGQEGQMRRSFRKLPVTAAAAILLLVLISGTALASALTGGGFFAGLFSQKAEGLSQAPAYMDVSQLPEIAGTTIGTVVDTNELRIDVMDVVSSGSDAMVALRVTAKQLDTVLRDNGWGGVPLNNYRFGSDTDGTLFEKMDSGHIQYVYCDEDASLADNQMYLILTASSLEGFSDGPYTLELRSFCYYDRSSAAGSITTVYPGPWVFTLELGGDAEHSRVLFFNQNVSVGAYNYCIESIYLTPFSFTAAVTYDGEPDSSSERYRRFWEAVSDLSLITTTGETVGGTVRAGNGGAGFPEASYQVSIQFQVPVSVSAIAGIHIFGQDYPLPPSASTLPE